MEERREFVDTVTFARHLRKNATPAERALWYKLRSKQTGFKFVRQHPVGRRIADFCCRQLRLVVEIDGASHEDRSEQDEVRDRVFKEAGYHVLRFTNARVLNRIGLVVEQIKRECEARPTFRY
jgi:very-short-patch-repair endonuclease